MNVGLPRDSGSAPPAPAKPVPDASISPPDDALPQARIRRSRLSAIWLVPLVAALIAGYLGWQTLSNRGPLITVHFRTADGLVAGQTRVRHKAVDLGTVERIGLTPDMREVLVDIRMTREAEPYLTDQARFWVVRPRFTGGSVSGIETLVSGAYIEMDPGSRDGRTQYEFTGLEQPPGVRSDEPGETFTLRADRLGSLGPGAPVFYRDVAVGEVLGYDLGAAGPATIRVFIRAPYDSYVKKGTRFWNASGLSVQVGSGGIHVELASLQAVLSGGVAFSTPPDAMDTPAATASDVFRLYHTSEEASAAGYRDHLSYVAYFNSSVRGLNPGAPVEIYGIQVGTVREVRLELTPEQGNARVRVDFDVQPERVLPKDEINMSDATAVARRLVGRGMRAQLKTASYLTGQLVLALDIVPNAAPAELGMEGRDVVIPSQGGGLDNILSAVSGIASKLDGLPIDRIANSLDSTLMALRDTVASPELRQAIRSLQGTLAGTEGIMRKADAGLTPLLNRLPAITQALQGVLTRTNQLVAGLNSTYSSNSNFQRELQRALDQVGSAARSIRLLADYLDRHPEALVRGRAGVSSVR